MKCGFGTSEFLYYLITVCLTLCFLNIKIPFPTKTSRSADWKELHLAAPRDLYQVICPPCRLLRYVRSFYSWTFCRISRYPLRWNELDTSFCNHELMTIYKILRCVLQKISIVIHSLAKRTLAKHICNFRLYCHLYAWPLK